MEIGIFFALSQEQNQASSLRTLSFRSLALASLEHRGVSSAPSIGTITLYNDTVSAINGGTDKSAALYTDGGSIIMQGGSLTSANNSTAIAYDAQNVSGSIFLNSDVNFHQASTTGLINYQNVIANSLYEPFGSLVVAPNVPTVTQVADGGSYSSLDTLLYHIYGFNGSSYSSTFAQTASLTIGSTGNCLTLHHHRWRRSNEV